MIKVEPMEAHSTHHSEIDVTMEPGSNPNDAAIPETSAARSVVASRYKL